jgi:hypothetical protein
VLFSRTLPKSVADYNAGIRSWLTPGLPREQGTSE